ncbi:hypothetical protein FOPG_07757 [Fusarium oxysporum f. sp. conglutinans race 2 54008]|uniref:Uncharacterized protein n=1 Tax=Fusarium oxysporum f. sp. conglutinans race 2 54008 TaxID=1089457 RepID=X0I169_FUSOX|nr:hypothetical protein FOPG_07757 [Fusarium oxysporum f. sp. conglutinans race 2 54008]
MHEDCYELLGKVAKPRKIDTAALYQVFTAHLPPPSHGSPNALDFDYGPVKEYQSKSWPNAQGIGALKKAHKSIAQEIGPLPNVPTGPAADRGHLKMHRPGRANPTELGRITINGEHERHLEITKWLCMQATKAHGEISARSGSRANILCRRIFLTRYGKTSFPRSLPGYSSFSRLKKKSSVVKSIGSCFARSSTILAVVVGKEWMGEIIIIARDPETQETFLIEQARHHEDNHYDVYDDDEVGEHGEVFDTRLVTVYDCQDPRSFAAPLHVDCYEILQDAYKPRKVTLSALYDTLTGYCSPTRNKHQPNSLDLDYGLPSGPFEVDMVNPNNEFTLASPSHVDECIEDMVQELFRISRKSKKSKNGNIPQTSFANGYGEKISPSKIYADMSWAKHYLPRTGEMRKRRIDWKRLYMNLDLLGKGKGEGNFKPNVRMHLENWRRIWSVCTRLLGECLVREKKNQVAETNERKSGNKSNKPTDKIIKGAVSSLMPLLTFPADSKTTYASVNLINKMNDMEKAEPVIRVYWTDSKELAGTGVHDSDKNTTKTIGSEDLFHSSEDAQIPKDDWLVAIFITTKEVSGENNPKLMQRKALGIRFVFLYDNFIQLGQSEGDIRVLVPKDEHIVVSIGGSWAPGKPLEKLVLLQQDLEKVPSSAFSRIGMSDFTSFDEAQEFQPDTRIANFLWRGQIPTEHKIWPSYPLRLDPLMPTPVEALLFENKTDDPYYKLRVGVDVQFQSDENITKCYVTGKDKVEGLRFLTDKGQHFIVGRIGQNEKILARGGRNGETIKGFHCQWSNKNTSDSALTSFGVFTLDDVTWRLGGERESNDSRGFYWIPNRPQTEYPYAEVGPIHGQIDKIERLRYPDVGVQSPQAVVTWLDCSKPLETISVIMCHSTTTELLMITSMAFEYAEGHEPMYFGPFAISEPEHEKNVSKQGQCNCIHGGSFEVEIEDIPHFEIGGWNPNGAYLKTLRLWVDSLGIITGLQFVTEASESQKWGFCEGEHSAELDLRTKEEKTAEIKFFLDSNGRNDVGEDAVVVAVQLIEVKKPAPKPKPPKMKKYKISK